MCAGDLWGVGARAVRSESLRTRWGGRPAGAYEGTEIQRQAPPAGALQTLRVRDTKGHVKKAQINQRRPNANPPTRTHTVPVEAVRALYGTMREQKSYPISGRRSATG
jgi:hypothetical protein